jgi:hypothetical protein
LERPLVILNTPLLCGKSAAELLLGKTLHDSLPRYPGPSTLDNETKAKILDLKKKEKDTYDQHTTPLPPLQIGTRVAIRSPVESDWSLLGTIAEIERMEVTSDSTHVTPELVLTTCTLQYKHARINTALSK